MTPLMERPAPARIDEGFEFVRLLRRMERHWDEFRDPGFWMRVNPHLTITDRPFPASAPPRPGLTPPEVERGLAQLDGSGFITTPPVVPETVMAPMRTAIAALAAQHIPTYFACVYDEFYQCFAGLDPLLVPVLGESYRGVGHGLAAFHVPPRSASRDTATAAVPPHRDSLGPDPRVLAGERPGILNVWIALTDVTTADSCIYAVPRYADAAYATATRDVTLAQFGLQDVRALPVAAGSLIAWSTHLAHWGSCSTPEATGPRMSLALYFQRADLPAYDPSVFDRGGVVTFAQRMRWILQSIGGDDLLARFGPDLT